MNEESSTPSSPASNREGSGEETRLHEMGDVNLHAETRDHLFRAELGLTDTLHRLQHLRSSLAELSERLPQDLHIQSSSQDIGPTHSAIVLSDANADDNTVPDMERLRSTIPSAIMQRLEEYEAVSGHRSERAGGGSSDTSHTPTSRQLSNLSSIPSSPTQSSASRTRPTYRAPPFPDLVIPARRSWLEASLSRHRDTNSDDGSTILGRRVAARIAAGGGSSSESPMPQLEQIFLNRTTEIARDLENAVNRLASHRAARLVDEALRSARPLARDSNTAAGLQAHEDRAGGHMIGSLPSRSTDTERRRSFGQTIGGMGLQLREPSEHGGTAPSDPNISTVTTTLVPRPPQPSHEGLDRPATEQASQADNRSYLIRRRLNADGDEQIHNINLMNWDSENDETDDGVTESVPDAQRRRRGWARLDADGNEITTEVEDEIERARAQSRASAYAQIRMSASSAIPTLSPIELGAARRETFVSMTRTSITHTSNETERITARVRINPRQTAISPLTNDATYVNSTSSEIPGPTYSGPQSRLVNRSPHSLGAFVVNPLPIPLVDMMPHPPNPYKPYPRTIGVHKYANLAGR